MKNTSKTILPYIKSLLIAILTLGLTPIVVIHYCDSGCREFEYGIGIFLVLISYLYSYYGKLPKKKWRKFLILLVWLVIVFGITYLYFEWIHGEHSPWPSTMKMEEIIIEQKSRERPETRLRFI